jgi:hypothetical protein
LPILSPCQSSNFWSVKAKYSLDLHDHGYAGSDENGPRRDSVFLTFVSDSAIVGAIAQRTTSVFAFDMSRNTVRDLPYIPVTWNLFSPISGRRVILRLPTGINACDEHLDCATVLKPAREIAASPLGSRIVVTRRSDAPRIVVDTATWKTLAEIPLRPLDQIVLGDEHFFVPLKIRTDLEREDGQRIHLGVSGPIAEMHFLDADRIAVTSYVNPEVAVFDLTGNPKYVIKTDYRTSQAWLLTAAPASRFAIVERGFNFWNRLTKFLDINDTRPADFFKIRIFETANGKQIAEFVADPPGGSRFALSPNGRLLACERHGELRVIAIP